MHANKYKFTDEERKIINQLIKKYPRLKDSKGLQCLLLMHDGASETEASKKYGITKQAVNDYKKKIFALKEKYTIKTILESRAHNIPLTLKENIYQDRKTIKSRSVKLSIEQKSKLKNIVSSQTHSELEKTRALIVLLLDQGLRNKEIAERVGVHENTVVKWRGRWTGDNTLATIEEKGDKSGRPRTALNEQLFRNIRQALKKQPPEGKPRWTIRSLATELNINHGTCQRALKELGIDLAAPSSHTKSH